MTCRERGVRSGSGCARVLGGFALVLGFLGGTLAPGGPAVAAESVERRLPNGLRVILVPHRANPMVASSVIVGAGVIHEPDGMNGASHFLEHLLFNGTTTRTQRELYDEVDRYGAYNNATTREDHTLFTLLIQKEFAAQGLALQADMLFRSTLPEDKFDKEKGIVLEELAKDRNDPEYAAGLAFREFAYAGTPLARAVLGTEESIGGMRRDDVLAYYRSRYVPANMTLVVMGDFAPDEMLATVKATFGGTGTEPAETSPPAARGVWPEPAERNLAGVAAEGDGSVYLKAAIPLAGAPHDPPIAAAELWIAALAEGNDAPLSRALREGDDPPARSFSLAVAPRTDGWSTLEFHATLADAGRVDEVLGHLTDGLRGLDRPGGASERLAAVRRSARFDEILLADQIHYYAMMRSAYITGSPPGYLTGRADALASLDESTLRAAAERLRRAPDELRIVVAGPGVEAGERRYRPGPPPAAPGAPPRVVSETLDSGMEVHLARNDDSQVFALHLMFRPRSASEPKGKEGIAALLHRLFPQGAGALDRAALAARFDELGMRVKTHDNPWIPYDDYYTSPEYSFVRMEMPADRWREGVGLVAEMVRRPRLDDTAFAAARTDLLEHVKRRDGSTRAAARALMARALAPEHPLAQAVLGSEASVSSITLDDLRAFHARYVTGRRAILTAVGPVDPRALAGEVRRAFGGLAAGEAPPKVPPPPITKRARTLEDALGKEQAYVALGYVFEASAEDAAALRVAGAMLSDALAFELRERQGLAYSLGASLAPFGSRWRLSVAMGTRRENLDRAVDGLREGVAAFRNAEPDPDAVARAAAALRGRLLMRRMTRLNQAYYAALEHLHGGRSAPLDRLLSVTPEDVRRVVSKHVDPKRCATVIVR